MSVYFHGSFGLNRLYMGEIVKLALRKPNMTDAELAKPFGYGAPFAAKYRSWLDKTGIAQLGRPLKLTPKGEVILKNDPKFKSNVTHWFMHWELTQDANRSEAWHFFVNHFLPKNATFTRTDLIEGLTEKLRTHSEKHFGPGSKLNVVIARKLIECYTQNYALGDLGIINSSGNQWVRGKIRELNGPWDSPEQLEAAF